MYTPHNNSTVSLFDFVNVDMFQTSLLNCSNVKASKREELIIIKTFNHVNQKNYNMVFIQGLQEMCVQIKNSSSVMLHTTYLKTALFSNATPYGSTE